MRVALVVSGLIVCMVIAALAMPAVVAAPTAAAAPGSNLHINQSWSKTICCTKDKRDFWSTERQCRLADGAEAKSKRCHDADAKVKACCKKAARTWWSNRRDCRRTGIVVVDAQCKG